MLKYELTNETKVNEYGKTLYRIKALKDFKCFTYGVTAGDLGGWIENEENLSHNGTCWVAKDAEVFDNAKVSGNALIIDSAKIFERAFIYENAKISQQAKIHGNAWIHGDGSVMGTSNIYGVARIYDNAYIQGDVAIFGNTKIYGDAKIGGDLRLGGDFMISNNAEIFSRNHYREIANFLPDRANVVIFRNSDRKLSIACHRYDFVGNLKEFKKWIYENIIEYHTTDYLLVAELIEKWHKAYKKTF